MSLAQQAYYKAKPKKSVKVKAIASIELPFYAKNAKGDYYSGNSIPSTGKPRQIVASNGVLFSDGAATNTRNWMDPKSDFGFRSPEEQFCYRYGKNFSENANSDGTNNAVSFETIYCEWDKYKFTNFVIESLVGKALTQAIAYNYFGYPVSNVSRRIDLNLDNEQNAPWYFGRMPNLGSSPPLEPVPLEDLNMNAGSIGGFNNIKNNGTSVASSLAGINPAEIGADITLLDENTNDDVRSRFLKMLGGYRKFGQAFVQADEFVQYYTNSHVFEIRDYPVNEIFNFGTPPTLDPSKNSGEKENDPSVGDHEDFLSGRSPDENFLYISSLQDDGKISEAGLGSGINLTDYTTLNFIQDKASEKYSNVFQPLTKTQARLWYPSYQTSLGNSPLHVTMGGADGIKRSDWYFDKTSVSNDQILSFAAQQGPLDLSTFYNASFKTSNLVSMFKLVPAGIPQEEREKFLDNPHFTLNHILPKMMEYIAKIVPQNPRFAGPKPASVEPYSKTFKSYLSWMESPTIKEEEGEEDGTEEELDYYAGCTPLQVHRVVSGSFFEFQVGRKFHNAPYLARDPRPEIVSGGDLISNGNYEKLGTQEKKDANDKYSVGYFGSAKGSPPQENIDYAGKFGLWNNDWVGGYAAKYYQKNGESQKNSLATDQYTSIRPGGFMVLPRNTRTIKSMLNSLPTQNFYGLEAIASAIANESKSFELTKLTSDLWLSYHFATKPNGMGFTSKASKYYSDGIRNAFSDWGDEAKWVDLDFTLNTLFDKKVTDGSGIQYFPSPASLEMAQQFNSKHAMFNDVEPLLFKADASAYGKLQASYAGKPLNKTSLTSPGFDGYLNQTSIDNERGTNVPVRVRRVSQLEFPIWSWKRGGGQGWSDLNSIDWPALIEDPSDTNSPYAASAFNKWKNYIQQNPSLLNQSRECVPRWVTSLRIYPTVKEDALKFGFVPNTLPITEQQILFKSGWDLDDALGGDIGEAAGNNQYMYQDFFWSFEDQFSNNTLLHMDMAAMQSEYLKKSFSSDLKSLKTYKTSDKLADACHPWMTLNFELDNNVTSDTYRTYVDEPTVDLTYAVELEIDEVKLVLDLVKMGVVGLAGTSPEYAELGLNLQEIFESVEGSNTLYSESLLQGYETYNASSNQNAGSPVDFGAFPSVLHSPDIPFKAQQEALEAQPIINEKIEDAKQKYPQIDNPINSYVWLKDSSKKTAIYSGPSNRSPIMGYINNFTTVRVLKEWVKGSGEFNRIRILDETTEDMNETEGFISPEFLEVAVEDLFFSTGIAGGKGIFDKGSPKLKLKPAEIRPMSEMARAVVPTWWKQKEPYYYLEDGEYWHTVELTGEDCVVDDSDLDAKKKIAVQVGLRQLFDFYGKKYSDSTIDKFAKSYLAARIDDYQLDIRPGSNIKFLLKVGAIYLNAVPNKIRDLSQVKKQSPLKLSLNQQFYEKHLIQGLFGLNKIYLDIATSEYTLRGINFIKEIERLEQVPFALKRMLAINNVDVATNEENTIELGFNELFKLQYVSYIERSTGKERILDVGFDYFSNLSPINNPNTMSLFYNHRALRNPLLKWRDAVNKYFVNPKPQIIKKNTPSKAIPPSVCGPLTYTLPSWRDILGPIAANLDKALTLDPRFDLGSFQFSLYKYLPPCPKPPSGVGDTLLYSEYEINGERKVFTDLEALKQIEKAFDLQNAKEYVGDWFSSADAIEDIRTKILDMEDLNRYFAGLFGSNMSEIITNIYSRICKCFLEVAGIDTVTLPNLELDANAGSIGKKISPSSFLSPNGETGILNSKNNNGLMKDNDVSGVNPFSDPGKDFDAENLFCSFCIEIPSYFLRLPTTNIMDQFVNALKKLLETLLAQLILALIQALMDILLTCPELSCPEGERNVRDYGANNLADIFDDNTDDDLPNFFAGCGLIIDGETLTGDEVLEFMHNISQRLSSGECLSLITGGINDQIMIVAKEEIAKYPGLENQLDNEAKIDDFFTCAGIGLPSSAIAELEDDILNKYKDPEICSNILNDAKEKLAERCGASDLLDASADRALNFDVDKYKKLADAIRKNQDLTNDIPSLFSDCFGGQGVLSGLANPALDFGIEQSVEAIIDPVRRTMKRELLNLTEPILDLNNSSDNPIASQAALVKHSPKIADMKRSNSIGNAIELCSLHPGLPFGAAASLLIPQTPGLGIASVITAMAVTPPVNADNTFKDVLFGSNIKVNKNLQLVPVDDTLPIDNLLFDLGNKIVVQSPQDEGNDSGTANVTVPINEATGESMKLELLPATADSDGNIVFNDNYSLELTIQDVLDVKGLDTIQLTPKDDQLPDQLVNHLQDFPMDVTSQSPPQAQYFAELILQNLEKDSGNDLLSDEFRSFLKDALENDIYWSIWKASLDFMADALGDCELLRDIELNRQDEFIGFNPFLFIPGLAVVIGLVGVTTVVGQEEANAFYGGKFVRKEMTKLDMQSSSDSDAIINIDKLKKIIKDNYDFSRAHNPNSETMGMPHYAILQGLVSGLIQLFCGEIFVRGIVPLSKFPIGVMTTEEYTVEIIFRSMNEWIHSGSNEFRVKFVKIMREIFKPCNSSTILFVSDNPDDESVGIPGTATGLEKDYRIESWEDGLRFLIRQEMHGPAKFVKNKLQSFKTSTGVGIAPQNPVSAVTYGKMLSVPDGAFQLEQDNNSLFSGDKKEAFKNGKLFLQYYFEIVDWDPEDEQYIPAVAQRDESLKGIMSEDNFVELVSKLCGIPTGFPQNYESNNPILTKSPEGDEGSDNLDLAFKDLFKEINFGLRMCYGAIQTTQTETPGGKKIIEDQNPRISSFVNKIKEFVNIKDGEVLYISNDAGIPSLTPVYQPGPEEDIFKFSKLTKSLLLAEDFKGYAEYGVNTPESNAVGSTIEVIDPLYTVVLPLFSQKVRIGGSGAFEDGFPLFNTNTATLNYLSSQLRLFTATAGMGSGYSSKVMSKLFTDFFTSPEYEGIFRYAIPIPKLASMLTVHNVVIASKDENMSKAFNLTKAQIKDLIMKVTELVGPEMYKKPFV